MSTAVVHRRALYGHNRNAAWQAYLEGELPEGYRRVEYIESTGAQWIDTGYTPDSNTSVISKWTKITGYHGFFGSFGTHWTDRSFGCNGSGSFYDNYYNDTTTGYASAAVNGKTFLYEKRKNSTVITGDIQWSKTHTARDFTCPHSMYVFALHCDNTVAHKAAARCYYLYIEHNGTQVRHYIPALRLSDNKPGMYDLCGSICPLTGTPFYINAGTGADFLWKEFDGPHTDEVWYWAPEQVTLYSQTGIKEHTFRNGKGVVKFNAPVTTVGQALRETDVTEVRLPDGITKIGDYALCKCTKLEYVNIPAGVTSIGTWAFVNCSLLKLDAIPAGITYIGNEAFFNCYLISLSALPTGLSEIRYNVFQSCRALILTSLPEGIKNIGVQGFQGCTSLALTSLPDGLTSISNSAFNGCSKIALTSIPTGVTSIPYRAFFNCPLLELTEFHSAVNDIGDYAFYNDVGLTALTFLGTPTTIYATAFIGCTNLTDIYVPWSEGEVANAPWGATNATIHYNHTAS